MLIVLAVAAVLGVVVAGVVYDSRRTSEADAYVPPADLAGPSAVFIGDSYTSGAGASELSKRWTSLLAADRFWDETNLGIGSTGYLTTPPQCPSGSCANFDTVADEAIASRPRIVVVAGGTNDFEAFVKDPTPVVSAIYETFGKLRTGLPDARIIAVGPSTAGDVPPFVSAFDSVVRDAAAASGAEFVSLTDPIDVVSEDMLAPDGLHVDDTGHAAIAARVNEAIR